MADLDPNQIQDELESTTDTVDETQVAPQEETADVVETTEETPVSQVDGEIAVEDNAPESVEETQDAEPTDITSSDADNQPITDTDEPDTNPVTSGGAALEERGSGKKQLRGHIVINKLDVPDAHWYVVHTTSGHEARIAESLRQRIETMGLQDYVFELLIPTQDRVIIRGGKKYTVKEKIFPGYLLVKMVLTDEAWLAVRTTQGITGFVGAGTKPSPLSESEVQNIQKFVAAPAARYKVRFSVGEAVKITDGPFSQFLGTINEMDEARGKVKVLVSIFGRETPVELDFLQIAKV
jgi:transcription termination/antitermination protein NusG